MNTKFILPSHFWRIYLFNCLRFFGNDWQRWLLFVVLKNWRYILTLIYKTLPFIFIWYIWQNILYKHNGMLKSCFTLLHSIMFLEENVVGWFLFWLTIVLGINKCVYNGDNKVAVSLSRFTLLLQFIHWDQRENSTFKYTKEYKRQRYT